MFDSWHTATTQHVVLRRLVRSLPTRRGVIAVGTCDKGLPAMTMALASFGGLAGAVIPGGVTLPPRTRRGRGCRADARRAVRARARHARRSRRPRLPCLCHARWRLPVPRHRRDARRSSRRPSVSRCPHAALAPSGQPIWLDVARRTAAGACHAQWSDGRTLADVLTPLALENAMLVHAAFGGSTNLLIHIPADRPRGRVGPADRRRLAAASIAPCPGSSTRSRTGRTTTRPCEFSLPAAFPR